MIWFALVCMFVGVILWELVKFVTEERRETIETRYDRLRRLWLAGGKEEGGDEPRAGDMDYREQMLHDREVKAGRR